MELFKQSRIFDFFSWSKITLIISLVLILISTYLFFGIGFNLGIDFAGGSVAQLQYSSHPPLQKIRDSLATNPLLSQSHVSQFGSDNEVLIKIPFNEKLTINELSPTLESILRDTGNFEIRKLDSVGAKVGKELSRSAIISLSLALIAIFVYVSFRYEWRFAISSVLVLFHDVVITAASVIVFNIDLNLDVIAALLTLIGYSINDTIIVFDRIREKMMNDRSLSISQVINDGVSSTLSRTIFTSLTMFLVVLTLYIFGGDIIVGFSLSLLIGVIFGTYSSIFVAPRLAVLFGFSIEEYHKKEISKIKKKEEKERLRRLYEGGRV